MENINQAFNDNYETIDNLATFIAEKYKVPKDELLSYGFEAFLEYMSDKSQEKPVISNDLYHKLYRRMKRSVPKILGFGDNQTLFWKYTREAEKLINKYEEAGIEVSIDVNFVTEVIDAIAENIVKKSGKKVISETKQEWINLILLCNSVSLNEICEECDLAYLEKLSEAVEGEYFSKELKDALLDATYSLHLTPSDNKLFIERYGLDDAGMKTYKKLSDKYYITSRRVRNIEGRALKKLKAENVKRKLKQYTDYDYRINGSNPSSEIGRIIT